MKLYLLLRLPNTGRSPHFTLLISTSIMIHAAFETNNLLITKKTVNRVLPCFKQYNYPPNLADVDDVDDRSLALSTSPEVLNHPL